MAMNRDVQLVNIQRIWNYAVFSSKCYIHIILLLKAHKSQQDAKKDYSGQSEEMSLIVKRYCSWQPVKLMRSYCLDCLLKTCTRQSQPKYQHEAHKVLFLSQELLGIGVCWERESKLSPSTPGDGCWPLLTQATLMDSVGFKWGKKHEV